MVTISIKHPNYEYDHAAHSYEYILREFVYIHIMCVGDRNGKCETSRDCVELLFLIVANLYTILTGLYASPNFHNQTCATIHIFLNLVAYVYMYVHIIVKFTVVVLVIMCMDGLLVRIWAGCRETSGLAVYRHCRCLTIRIQVGP